MYWLKNLVFILIFLLLAGGIFGAAATYDRWQAWLLKPEIELDDEEDHDNHDDHDDHLDLTPQARESIGHHVKPVQLQTYQRKLRIPARIVTQPGKSKRTIATHLFGVVEEIYAYPGQIVRPGDKLFKLHLVSDHLQDAQDALHRTASELAINKEEQQRLAGLAKTGAVSAKLLLNLQYERRKLEATDRALRHKLSAHGIPDKTVDAIAHGDFVKDWTIYVPEPGQTHHSSSSKNSTVSPSNDATAYEIGTLNVEPGSEVKPGAALCTLLNLGNLYVEGQFFRNEIDLVEPLILDNTKVVVEFDGQEDDAAFANTSPPSVQLQFLSHDADPESQTVSAYGELNNPYQTYHKDGQEFRLWRYRPGQRAYLNLPVQSFDNVFVLPAEAVVRDGASAYLFREIGKNAFEKVEVRLLYNDRENAVLYDVNIDNGDMIAQNAAAQLYREFLTKSQQGGDGHEHHHH